MYINVTIDGCCKPSEIGGSFLGPHYRTSQGCSGDRTGWNGQNLDDWGISWFEILTSFYLSTGGVPWRQVLLGQRRHIWPMTSYDHPDALLLPDAKRSVSLQILCLRNLLQNASTILDHDILPTFPTSRRAIPCHVLAESSWFPASPWFPSRLPSGLFYGQITGTYFWPTQSLPESLRHFWKVAAEPEPHEKNARKEKWWCIIAACLCCFRTNLTFTHLCPPPVPGAVVSASKLGLYNLMGKWSPR